MEATKFSKYALGLIVAITMETLRLAFFILWFAYSWFNGVSSPALLFEDSRCHSDKTEKIE
jgi:hypothetical protein